MDSLRRKWLKNEAADKPSFVAIHLLFCASIGKVKFQLGINFFVDGVAVADAQS